jgi:hypothetical protein
MGHLNKLEIFILSYNRLDLLKICVSSFLNLENSEAFSLTIIDNASEFDVHKEFSTYRDKNLNFIRNDSNLGGYGNFRKAVEISSKEFVLIFHDDDCVSPSLINTQLNLFNKNPDVGFIVTGVNLVEDINKLMSFTGNDLNIVYDYYRGFGDILDLFFSQNILGFSSIMYKTKILKSFFHYTDEYAQVGDRALMLNLSLNCPFIHLKNPTYNAYQHANQESSSRTWSFDYDLKLINLYIKAAIISNKTYLLNKIFVMASQLYAMRSPLPSFRYTISSIKFNSFFKLVIFVVFIPYFFVRSRLVSIIRIKFPLLYRLLLKLK